jgi:hypothetical protein
MPWVVPQESRYMSLLLQLGALLARKTVILFSKTVILVSKLLLLQVLPT